MASSPEPLYSLKAATTMDVNANTLGHVVVWLGSDKVSFTADVCLWRGIATLYDPSGTAITPKSQRLTYNGSRGDYGPDLQIVGDTVTEATLDALIFAGYGRVLSHGSVPPGGDFAAAVTVRAAEAGRRRGVTAGQS